MGTEQGDGTIEEPLNREPRLGDLVNSFITPSDSQAYDRNHGPIPHISKESHQIKIDGLVPRPITLSISDLESQFPQHNVICALQCAGNRRHAMRTQLQEVQGIDWFDGAILNAKWTGPLLRDVLLHAAGLEDDHSDNNDKDLHVQLSCSTQATPQSNTYGGSIPLARALNQDAEVILALHMNDQPLTVPHGFPVRCVVPGVIGARSIKWLDRITVSKRESENFYQKHDYKVLASEVTDAEKAEREGWWDKTPPMMDNVINCVVASPEDGENLRLDAGGMVRVKGYAVPGGMGGPVTRVEVAVVSGDKGEDESLIGEKGKNVDWVEASLGPREKWSWCLWEADVKADRGEGMRVLCRATDCEGNTQTELRSEWNLRGVGYNGFESTLGLRIV